LGLCGGDQPDPIWLHAQLRRWLETRGETPALIEHVQLAEELATHAIRDLADLIPPFSATQATIRLERLLDAERCEKLCRVHEQVANFWREQRQRPGATV